MTLDQIMQIVDEDDRCRAILEQPDEVIRSVCIVNEIPFVGLFKELPDFIRGPMIMQYLDRTLQ